MIVIGTSGYFHPLCIKKDGKEFEESWLFLDAALPYNYLGKSKANIDDLFEVEKPFSVEDTIEKIENFLLEN